MKPGLILMGRVLGAFGIRGEIRIFYYGEDPGLLSRAGQAWIGANPETARPFTAKTTRSHKGRVLLQTDEVTDRDQAEALAGNWLYLLRSALPELTADEFYWFEIKGAEVRDINNRLLGKVVNISSNGAQDLLEIKGSHATTALIPLVKPILQKLDMESGLIVMDVPPGLLEAQGWPE